MCLQVRLPCWGRRSCFCCCWCCHVCRSSPSGQQQNSAVWREHHATMLIAFTHLHAAHAQVSIQLQQVNHHLRAQHCWCAVPLHTIARCVGIGRTHLRRMEATGQTCVGAHCILPYSTTGSGFHHLGPNFKHGVRRWSSVGSNHCWLWPWNNLHIEVRKAYGGWVLEISLRVRRLLLHA